MILLVFSITLAAVITFVVFVCTQEWKGINKNHQSFTEELDSLMNCLTPRDKDVAKNLEPTSQEDDCEEGSDYT